MCSNAIAGLNSCPGFHVPGQWLQGKVWIEHQWTFIIRWCHFKKADFPRLLIISQKTVEHMEVKFLVCRPCICWCEARSWGLRNTGLRNVTVWKFSKDAKKERSFWRRDEKNRKLLPMWYLRDLKEDEVKNQYSKMSCCFSNFCLWSLKI